MRGPGTNQADVDSAMNDLLGPLPSGASGPAPASINLSGVPSPRFGAAGAATGGLSRAGGGSTAGSTAGSGDPIGELLADNDFRQLAPHDKRDLVRDALSHDPDFAALRNEERVQLLNEAFRRFPDDAHSSDLVLTRDQVRSRYFGVKYKYGGDWCSDATDCSGFMKQLYERNGVRGLPRTAQDQYVAKNGQVVGDPAAIQPGDQLFFTGTNGRPMGEASHTGFYLGRDAQGRRLFVHNSSTKGGVTISDFDQYPLRWLGAKRYPAIASRSPRASSPSSASSPPSAAADASGAPLNMGAAALAVPLAESGLSVGGPVGETLLSAVGVSGANPGPSPPDYFKPLAPDMEQAIDGFLREYIDNDKNPSNAPLDVLRTLVTKPVDARPALIPQGYAPASRVGLLRAAYLMAPSGPMTAADHLRVEAARYGMGPAEYQQAAKQKGIPALEAQRKQMLFNDEWRRNGAQRAAEAEAARNDFGGSFSAMANDANRLWNAAVAQPFNKMLYSGTGQEPNDWVGNINAASPHIFPGAVRDAQGPGGWNAAKQFGLGLATPGGLLQMAALLKGGPTMTPDMHAAIVGPYLQGVASDVTNRLKAGDYPGAATTLGLNAALLLAEPAARRTAAAVETAAGKRALTAVADGKEPLSPLWQRRAEQAFRLDQGALANHPEFHQTAAKALLDGMNSANSKNAKGGGKPILSPVAGVTEVTERADGKPYGAAFETPYDRSYGASEYRSAGTNAPQADLPDISTQDASSARMRGLETDEAPPSGSLDTTADNTFQSLLADAKAAAEAAQKRRAKRSLSGSTGYQSGVRLDLQDLADQGVILAADVMQRAGGYTDWSRDMAREGGPRVVELLPKVWPLVVRRMEEDGVGGGSGATPAASATANATGAGSNTAPPLDQASPNADPAMSPAMSPAQGTQQANGRSARSVTTDEQFSRPPSFSRLPAWMGPYMEEHAGKKDEALRLLAAGHSYQNVADTTGVVPVVLGHWAEEGLGKDFTPEKRDEARQQRLSDAVQQLFREGRLSRAPGFYSTAERVLEEKMPERAAAAHVQSLLRSGGVRADEMRWSGLDDYLAQQAATGRPVNKSDVMDHLRSNQVQVHEVAKAGAEASWLHRDLKLPGGSDYRELLLTLPHHAHSFTGEHGSHWHEPNVVAHVRFNVHRDTDGKPVLHVEEVQSDWHQIGRRMGYVGAEGAAGTAGQSSAVPPAPFAETWHELAFRRMLRWAAEHGFERMTWTTGEQQAKRSRLERRAQEVYYSRHPDGRLDLGWVDDEGNDQRHTFPNADAAAQKLGKALVEQVMRSRPRVVEDGVRSGFLKANLRFGGEGLKDFYDRKLTGYAARYGRKWNATVGKTAIRAGRRAMEVHSIEVTPAMAASVLRDGQPLFAKALHEAGGTAATSGGRNANDALVRRAAPGTVYLTSRGLHVLADLFGETDMMGRPVFDGAFIDGQLAHALYMRFATWAYDPDSTVEVRGASEEMAGAIEQATRDGKSGGVRFVAAEGVPPVERKRARREEALHEALYQLAPRQRQPLTGASAAGLEALPAWQHAASTLRMMGYDEEHVQEEVIAHLGSGDTFGLPTHELEELQFAILEAGAAQHGEQFLDVYEEASPTVRRITDEYAGQHGYDLYAGADSPRRAAVRAAHARAASARGEEQPASAGGHPAGRTGGVRQSAAGAVPGAVSGSAHVSERALGMDERAAGELLGGASGRLSRDAGGRAASGEGEHGRDLPARLQQAVVSSYGQHTSAPAGHSFLFADGTYSGNVSRHFVAARQALQAAGIEASEPQAMDEYLRLSGALRVVVDTRTPDPRVPSAYRAWGKTGISVQVGATLTPAQLASLEHASRAHSDFFYDIASPGQATPVFGQGFKDFLYEPLLDEALRQGRTFTHGHETGEPNLRRARLSRRAQQPARADAGGSGEEGDASARRAWADEIFGTAPPSPGAPSSSGSSGSPARSPRRAGGTRKPPTAGRASLLETLTALRRAGLLTAPATHVRNILSNTSFQAMEEAARVPAAMADMVIAAVNGSERTVGGADPLAYLRKPGLDAARKGVADTWAIVRNGRGLTPAELEKLGLDRPFASGSGLVDAYVNFVFRAMSAGDKLFRAVAYQRSVAEQARLIAARETAAGPARAARARALEASPTSAMQSQAIMDAEVAAFGNSNALNTWYQRQKGQMERSGKLGEAASFALDTLMPFVKTPTNILARTLEYTLGMPYGTAQVAARRMFGRKLTPEQQRSFAQVFGRGTVGASLIGLGYLLASHGLATGPEDADETSGRRNVETAQGRIRGAVLVDGQWRRIYDVAPAGVLLSLGAALYEQGQRQPNPAMAAAGSGKALLTAASDNPYMKGLETGQGLASPRDMTHAWGTLLGSYVPSVLANAAEATDTVSRRAQGLFGPAENRVPGLRQRLPARTDVLGRPVPARSGASVLDPFNSRTADTDPVLEELRQQRVGLGRIRRRDDETEAERTAREQFIGVMLRKSLAKRIAIAGYQKLGPDAKAEALKGVIQSVRRRTVNVSGAQAARALRNIANMANTGNMASSGSPTVGAGSAGQR